MAIVATLLVLVASAAPAVLAQGKGKGKGQSGVTFGIGFTMTMYNDVNGDNLPNYGDSVTFSVSTPEQWNQVDVTCSQNGVPVFGASYPSSPVVTFSSMSWHGGAANCTAALLAWDSKKVLASLNFNVAE